MLMNAAAEDIRAETARQIALGQLSSVLLARTIGCSQAHVSNWLSRKRRLSLHLLTRVCERIGYQLEPSKGPTKGPARHTARRCQNRWLIERCSDGVMFAAVDTLDSGWAMLQAVQPGASLLVR